MNRFSRQVTFVIVLCACIFLLLPALSRAATGSGELTVSDDGLCSGTGFSNFNDPNQWDIFQGQIIHINIAPNFSICTSGVENQFGKKCDSAADCSTSNGNCQNGAGTCNTNSNGVCTGTCSAGNVGANCTNNAACNVPGTCTTGSTRRCFGGSTPGASCTSSSTCGGGTCSNFCNTGPNTGSACSSNTQCTVPGTCGFGSATCTAGKVGQACDEPTDCNTQTCSGNSTGLPPGSNCTDDFQCQAHTCSNGSPIHAGEDCSIGGDAFCNITGTCEEKLECEVDTCGDNGKCKIAQTDCLADSDCRKGDIYVKGTSSIPCSSDTDCDPANSGDPNTTTCRIDCVSNQCIGSGDACTTDADCSAGVCEFVDPILASVNLGQLDVCYTTREGMCFDAKVAYCGDTNRDANVQHPQGAQTHSPAFLRAVDETDGAACTDDADCITDLAPTAQCENSVCNSPITVCSLGLGTCVNEPGSFCCGLTQGAYGAPKSVATCNTEDCSNAGLGYVPAAEQSGCLVSGIAVFASDPNSTTIGLHQTGTELSVTLDNLNTLIAYLPAGGTPKQFNFKCPGCVGPDTHFDDPADIPDPNPAISGTKGQGGGALSGQTMATHLNAFLSSCAPPFGGSETFTASGFGGFELPDAGGFVCTKRSGDDKTLETLDDVCQAFGYANCVAGHTVSEVLAAANEQLSNGTNSLGCTPSELNAALSNINVEFDQCGVVIECPGGVVDGQIFACP